MEQGSSIPSRKDFLFGSPTLCAQGICTATAQKGKDRRTASKGERKAKANVTLIEEDEDLEEEEELEWKSGYYDQSQEV